MFSVLVFAELFLYGVINSGALDNHSGVGGCAGYLLCLTVGCVLDCYDCC